MQIEVSGINIPITEDIDDYIKRKFGKLNKYIHKISSARMTLKVEKERYLAELNVVSNRVTIHGKGESSDLYVSIETAIDKVNKQAKKHKEKVQSHRPRKKGENKVFPLGSLPDKTQPKIVHIIREIAKPMNADEAAMQLDIQKDKFLVFLNRDTDQVNVIYKRKNGNFGLIEPKL